LTIFAAVASLAAFVASVYQLTAAAAALRQFFKAPAARKDAIPISILKPVRGLDPDFLEAIRSYASQSYRAPFEILFGAADREDESWPVIQRLAAEFPHVTIRAFHSVTTAPNAKVAVLEDLAREAKYPLLLVADSDILVPPGYLEQVAAPLHDPAIALVTTLYRARGSSVPARWEALGVAIDFAPSVLVAPLVGIREFGLGATIVFRAADLDKIGGFASIRDYLADDYQLAKKLTALGPRAHMSEVIVETSIGASSWADVWKHQVRWARTIRVSRGDGYLGLPVTHAGVWILLAVLAGAPQAALALTIIRCLTAFLAGFLVLRSPLARFGFLLAPLWDLWAFLVWSAGLTGNTVIWRQGVLRLTKDGKLVRE
jgi:ceramide glucosyltransferase